MNKPTKEINKANQPSKPTGDWSNPMMSNQTDKPTNLNKEQN